MADLGRPGWRETFGTAAVCWMDTTTIVLFAQHTACHCVPETDRVLVVCPPRCFRLLASNNSLDANDKPHAVLPTSYLYIVPTLSMSQH
jgi:hypothetical protein